MTRMGEIHATRQKAHPPSQRQRQELASRHLIEVLELAEALPYKPRSEIDLPRDRLVRKMGAR